MRQWRGSRWMGVRIGTTGALALVAWIVGCGGGAPSDPPPVDTTAPSGPAGEVDPFIGTGYADSPYPVPSGRGGATFPGAALPFGMVQLGPDTPTADPPGYYYGDGAITGFTMNHLNGAGCAALRDVPLLATLEPPSSSGTAVPSEPFSHANEMASPGFYEVTLDSGVRVDLTATQRTGLIRFTFPEDADEGFVTLYSGPRDMLSALLTTAFEARVTEPDLITGSRTSGLFCVTPASSTTYFAIRFDRPIEQVTAMHGNALEPDATETSGKRSGMFVRFDTRKRKVVQLEVGLSFVSVEGALANLEAETHHWDFDATRAGAVEAWNARLGRVAIDGGSADDRTSFYTALYHVLLQPAIFDDVDGQFIAFDDQIHTVPPGHHRYVNFSGWDVYRSWIQLVSILAPDETGDFMQSLIDAQGECGALPRWSLENHDTGVMVGDPADPTLASAWAFGARGFEPQAALDAMLAGADDPAAACNGSLARPGLADYLALGFVPTDTTATVWGPTATTLEYAVADYAVARMADAAGDATTRDRFLARSGNWRNVFDVSATGDGFTGYPMPRYADPMASPAFDEGPVDSINGFVEGNAAQYTFLVPQDVAGLSAALGGDAAMVDRLDFLFAELNAGISRPHFYMGNEPQFGTPWLYTFVGAPGRTQKVVRDIVRQLFTAEPEGLPGNEDLGATSSWLAWAMLGLYPAVPGTGTLAVGSPLFPEARITLPSGGELVIEGQGAGPDAPYVQALTVDGAAAAPTQLDWSTLRDGATVHFELGATAP